MKSAKETGQVIAKTLIAGITTSRKTDRKEMRKQISKKIKEEPTLKPVKNPPPMDDRTIRALLRNSCSELQEEVFPGSMTDNIRVWVVQSLSAPTELNWVDPDFLKAKSDLFMFWNLYAQRQVFLFEQESSLLEDWRHPDTW
jgi:hypothetical protein